MNISDSNQDFASLLHRIELLEAEQNLCKQKVIWLKRYIDEFKKEFNTRPELQQIESLQHAISELSTHVDKLQQRLSLSNSLNNGDPTNTSSEQVNFDDARTPELDIKDISKVRIEAPLEVQKSWLRLFELMHDKGIITIVKKPTKLHPSRKRGILPAYFEIKLNREPEAEN